MANYTQVDIRGFEEAIKALEALPSDILKKCLDFSLRKAANIVRDDAKSRVYQQIRRRSGRIASSLKVKKGKGSFTEVQQYVTLGNKGFYGKFHELGYTQVINAGYGWRSSNRKGRKANPNQKKGKKIKIGFVPAKPFMRPALEENKEAILKMMAGQVKRYCDRYKGRGVRI